MISHLKETKPISSAASLRRQAPSSTGLSDLPDEVLEGIARYIGESFRKSAHLHPRLQQICRQVGVRNKSRYSICTKIQRVVASYGCNVSSLILTHCHPESTLILSCILHCPNLRELSTVNSGLTSRDLFETINFLSALESLSFSAFEPPAGDIPLADPPSIQRIYVESGVNFIPCAIELINSCIELEWLHIVEVEWSPKDIFEDLNPRSLLAPEFPFQVSRERWEKLRTVILMNTEMAHRKKMFNCVFRNRLSSLDVLPTDLLLGAEILYYRGYLNVRKSRYVTVPNDTYLLAQVYTAYYGELPILCHGKPRKLRIGNLNRYEGLSTLLQSLGPLSNLVELDMSGCHPSDSWQGWEALSRSSPGIENSKVPLCFLAAGSHQEVALGATLS